MIFHSWHSGHLQFKESHTSRGGKPGDQLESVGEVAGEIYLSVMFLRMSSDSGGRLGNPMGLICKTPLRKTSKQVPRSQTAPKAWVSHSSLDSSRIFWSFQRHWHPRWRSLHWRSLALRHDWAEKWPDWPRLSPQSRQEGSGFLLGHLLRPKVCIWLQPRGILGSLFLSS